MLQRIKSKLKEKKGFTLIEMIIVIAIIAILIALIAPNLMKYLGTAKQTKADAAAKTLYTAANTYLVEQYSISSTTSVSTGWNNSNVATEAAGFEDFLNDDEMEGAIYKVVVAEGVVERVYICMDGKYSAYPQISGKSTQGEIDTEVKKQLGISSETGKSGE